jgi:uncharacterized secreted protein with C-terminal beta-propeller domain
LNKTLLKEHSMSELSDRLAKLAGRGTPRDPADVFAAAQADATSPAPVVPLYRRTNAVMALAASLALVGAVVALQIDDTPKQPASNVAIDDTTTTGVGPTTPTTVSESTKVYLASTRLIPFNQCGTLSSYAKAKALDVVGPYGLPGGGGMMLQALDGAPTARRSAAEDSATAAPAAPATGGGTGGPTYSDTNVQEAGIDEPDNVKTDGKTIFHVSNNKVFATSTGSDPTLIGSLQIEGAQEMLRIADKLIVISPGYGVYAARGGPVAMDSRMSSMPYGGGSLQSKFTVVDISDPRAMKVTGHLDVEGSYLSARLVDGVARVVVRSHPNLTFAYPTDDSPEARAAATEHNKGVIRSATTDSWLPHYTATNASGKTESSKLLVSCDASYHPPSFAGFGMLNVLSFNTENPSFTRATSVMGDGQIVYASATRVYVATNSWGDVTGETTPNPTIVPAASTLIHAFDISDPVNAVYRSSGRVRGTVLNQFSLSEYKGALRVATTDPNGGSESFLTVLGDSGNALVQIGQVGGLGKGERIYAVRFIEDVGYVVTFRQVDPLYVIDLSQHTNPRIVGELKISGYSAYLHPIGDGLLLGVGQDATEEGRVTGVQVTIFDVRNPAAPKALARKSLGQGGSTAEFDHHAFLYWAATKLAVLPVSTYNPENGSSSFNGAVGLRIGDTTIDEVGRAEPPNSQMYGGIDRTVVIGNRLFMTSHRGVLVTTLDNLSATAWVAYPEQQPEPQPGETKPAPPPS